jgi:lipoprotein-releasing system permease protein
MMGVLFGTMAMIIVLSIFNGFDKIIQDLYQDIDPDFSIELNEGKLFFADNTLINNINNIEGVVCSEVLEYKMLAKYSNYQTIVEAKGVDDEYINVTNLEKHIILGNYFDSSTNFLITGSGVFNSLSLQLLDFEDPLQLSIFNDQSSILDINNVLKTESFYVTGVFSSQFELDNKYIFLKIDDLRNVIGLSRECSSLEVAVKSDSSISKIGKWLGGFYEGYRVQRIQDELIQTIGPQFIVKNREQQRPFVNKMIKTEKLVVYIIFTFILLISMFTLIATLIVLLMEKQNDIHILHSLGFPLKSIKNIFLHIGMLITLTGLLLGGFVGLFFCFLQDQFGFIKTPGQDVGFFIDAYPILINPGDVLLILVIVLSLGWLTSYLISRQNRFYPTY